MRNGIINKLSWRYAGKTVEAHFFFVIVIVGIKYVIISIGCVIYEKTHREKRSTEKTAPRTSDCIPLV